MTTCCRRSTRLLALAGPGTPLHRAHQISLLVDRFRAAMDFLLGDAREENLPTCVRNLHRVERDLLGVEETEIELPPWIA